MSATAIRRNCFLGVIAVCALAISWGTASPTAASTRGPHQDTDGSPSLGGDSFSLQVPPLHMENRNTQTSSRASGSWFPTECVDRVRKAAAVRPNERTEDISICEVSIEAELSAPALITSATALVLAKRERMSVAHTAAFLAAAAAGPIYSQAWEATATGPLFAYKEVMKGKVYYDLTKSWVSRYRGHAGSFACHTAGSYAVGVSISLRSCTKWRTRANGVAHRDRFEVSAGVHGSPISGTHELDAVLTRHGALQVTTR